MKFEKNGEPASWSEIIILMALIIIIFGAAVAFGSVMAHEIGKGK